MVEERGKENWILIVVQIVFLTVMTALFVGKHVAVELALFGLGTECLEENQRLKTEPSASPARHILIV